MKVQNIHTRIVSQPIAVISELFETLASDNDQMWPVAHWPRMKLDKGLEIGSKGGHGPIRYTVQEYVPGKFIKFKFSKPAGFEGTHQFELSDRDAHKTELKHSINMDIKGGAILSWPIAIRWLHDALIEDAFDTVENRFLENKKKSEWNLWVRFLRKNFKPRKNG